jgi:type II secretory pathway pseudopilin PulG
MHIRHWEKGVSLIEVLVGMAILLAGIISILNMFPVSMRASNDAAMLTRAAVLAQQKTEEIRRDSDNQRTLINKIRLLTAPTTPVEFPEDTRLAYSFCGLSLLDTVDDPDDPRDDVGVARIIVQYSTRFRKDGRVIYELRFDE